MASESVAIEFKAEAYEAFLAGLAAAGVPLSVLTGHGTYSLRWLQQHANDRFRLAYTNADGVTAVDRLEGAAAFLRRAHELGWTPYPADNDGQGVCYEDAFYYEYRGVHWHGTEGDDHTGVPLALPKSVQEAERRKRLAQLARFKREEERTRRVRERASNRRLRENQNGVMSTLADHEQRVAAEAGRSISRSTAVRRARQAWRQAVQAVQGVAAAGRAPA